MDTQFESMYPEGQMLKLQLFRKVSKSTEEHRLTTAQQCNPAGGGTGATAEQSAENTKIELISRKLDWQGKYEDKRHKAKA